MMSILRPAIAGCLAACMALGMCGAAAAQSKPVYKTRKIEGWKVEINQDLLTDPATMRDPIRILTEQLKYIEAHVPAPAVKRLKEVTLWFNPEYKGVGPGAEYHPGKDWLVEHGRNPDMVKGVEFTNARIYAQEYTRMPCFVLHELAHSYHDRVLGFDRPDIESAYTAAAASGKYDKVQRHNGAGRADTVDKAYAMSNAREYFAESTEAFFGQNDFFPFNNSELKAVDPRIYAILTDVWFTGTQTSPRGR